mmetsp:Transcript_12535/g.35591  ORF Transcript_12535/g.35591 Transcript_12535/m.35591 type:complete len:504 (-) Transcript_12535:11-1522(-)
MDGTKDDMAKDADHVEMAPLTAAKNVQDENDLNDVSDDLNLASIGAPCGNACALMGAFVSYSIQYSPRTFWVIAIFLLIVPSYYVIVDVFFNPIEHFGEIGHDYSNLNLQSNFDSQMRNIEHWCLQGDSDSCQCEDPTQPAPRQEFRRWTNAHAGNVMQIQNMIDQGLASPEIAFLGGSVIEKMDGRWFGDIRNQGLNEVAEIFNKHFDGKDGSMTAVALGIAADTNQAVLWRILNGEMPAEFNPKIWWLELGLNDLGRSQCSEEIVVIGILRIVEEIMKRKPDAKIVINSLFPMADLRGGPAPTQADLERSFGNKFEQRTRDRSHELTRPGPPNSASNNVPHNFRPLVYDKKKPITNMQFDKEKKKAAVMQGNRERNGTHKNRHLVRERPQRHVDGFRDRDRNRGDQKLLDRTSQHMFNPVTMQKRSLPLWTSIRAINTSLLRFCQKNDNVYFFDSTLMFAERDGTQYRLKRETITRTGLPTNNGYILWENAVATRAKMLLD